jgi:hypothetical protein
MPKYTEPELGLPSYSCPHCGALAAQHWFRLSPKQYGREEKLDVLNAEHFAKVDPTKIKEAGARKHFVEFQRRLEKNEVTFERHVYEQGSHWTLHNVAASLCHSCDAWAIWVCGKIVYPQFASEIEIHPDLPADLKSEVEEARTIVDLSPRGAAALLRLAMQKLMLTLGEPGKDLNADIAALVRKGLDADIQKALDIVRVIGNNAVHPGQIDLTDNKPIALRLFELLNLIVERMISTPKKLKHIFEGLPKSALEQIERRDRPKN